MTQFFTDRWPLISQKGNFSGKASAIATSVINGEWWRSDPSTGDVPVYVDRNAQWDINQGPVDMSIKFAQETETPTSMNGSPGYLPKKTEKNLDWLLEPVSSFWREIFVWHPFTKSVEEPVEFSVVATKF